MVEAFARLLREIGEGFGYRQEDLAKIIGVARRTISEWERNRQNPSRASLESLARSHPEYELELYLAARVVPRAPDACRQPAEELGELLREIRIRYKYRQADLAERIGADKSSVCGWESGKNLPSRTYVEDLAHSFPSYSKHLYDAAGLLPLELDAKCESEARRFLENILPRLDSSSLSDSGKDLS